MVLWEITVATAYFLGLRRTYRLALRIQRRIVRPNHPKLRQFLQRFLRQFGAVEMALKEHSFKRTRSVFDMALSVHRTIQVRDIEMGKSLGNWILRWLDRMKPSAQIRPAPPKNISNDGSIGRSGMASRQTHRAQKPTEKFTTGKTSGHLYYMPLNIHPKILPGVGKMTQPAKISCMNNHYRHFSSYYTPNMPKLGYRSETYEGVVRKDIAQWMERN
ncbi:hypothetical protein QJS10_CPB20g01210 [Acorus calamus]|uniref:Uncharacterized protein n=1 Tax=Acorus calamus TaxID=4465 RepID=A0AAV9C9J5_ACOCL|nr:hypothetical protein QJS10_CPB20g01210 [Acorus calamus]